MFHTGSEVEVLKSYFSCLKQIIFFTYNLVTFYGTVLVGRYECTFKTTDDIFSQF